LSEKTTIGFFEEQGLGSDRAKVRGRRSVAPTARPVGRGDTGGTGPHREAFAGGRLKWVASHPRRSAGEFSPSTSVSIRFRNDDSETTHPLEWELKAMEPRREGPSMKLSRRSGGLQKNRRCFYNLFQ